MRDLVVAYREGARSAGIEKLPGTRAVDREEPLPPQCAVDGYALLDCRDAVLAHHHDLHAELAGGADDVPRHRIHRTKLPPEV